MKIILKKEVANLGEAGDVVEVKTGYALNVTLSIILYLRATLQ